MLKHTRHILARASRSQINVPMRQQARLISLSSTFVKSTTAQQNLRFLSTSPDFNPSGNIEEGPSHMYLTSVLDTDHPASHNVYRFPIDFESSCQDIQFVQEGGYLEISDAEKERYLPEGYAGELKDEINDTERNAWMVREPSKLLCRMIDNFAFKCKIGANADTPEEGLRFPVHLQELTDKAEWKSSVMKIFSYGNKDLLGGEFSVQKPEKQVGEDDMMIVRGPGSVVETAIERVKSKLNGDLPSKVVLTGERGVGKSACLTHAVYHARKNGWICVFIPEGYDQVNGGPFIQPVEDVPAYEGLFDNSMMSAVALRNLWKAHHRDLRDIPLTDTTDVDVYTEKVETMKAAIKRNEASNKKSGKTFTALRAVEIGEEDTFEDEDELDAPIIDNTANFDITDFELKTLEDMVLFGIAFRDYAGPAFIHVLKELRSMDNPAKPVLIAIDQMNFWDMPTVFQYEGKKISSKEMCVPYAAKFLSEKKSENDESFGKNVLCIGASCKRYPTKKGTIVDYVNSRSSLPLCIEVPTYSHVEFLAAMKYYLQTGLIDEGVSDNELLAFRMHVGNNPRLMRRETTQFFMPIQAEYASNVFRAITTEGGGGGNPALARAADMEVPEEYRRDLEYQVETRRVDKLSEYDVDLTHLSEMALVKHMTDLAEHDDVDDIQMCDSLPLASRGNIDLDDIAEISR